MSRAFFSMKPKIISTEDEMIAAGRDMGQTLLGGDILLLSGPLGAGKTSYTKGIASVFGIPETEITSPTFTLMNVYPVPSAFASLVTFVHIDTYRLESEEELQRIGVEDYLGRPDCITIIEWPEKLDVLLKNKKTISVRIDHITGDAISDRETRRLVL